MTLDPSRTDFSVDGSADRSGGEPRRAPETPLSQAKLSSRMMKRSCSLHPCGPQTPMGRTDTQSRGLLILAALIFPSTALTPFPPL